MNWNALHNLMENPLWWVIPAVLVGSWVVNHRDPAKPSDSEKKSKDTSKSEPPAETGQQESGQE